MKKLFPVFCLFLAAIIFSACSSEEEKIQEENNFTILSESLKKRDGRSFCSALSSSSQEKVQPRCQAGIVSLWPRLEDLFRGAEPIGREGKIFFIQKNGVILSYPLVLEKGRWRADIIGPSGWRQ